LNAAGVEQEVRLAFERYEEALRSNDVAALNGFFLDSPEAVRYGIAEQHYGWQAIADYRRSAPPVHPQRRLLRSLVRALSNDVACVSAEFDDPASRRLGRQTQTWVRTAQGWRIAQAHVSLGGPV
jgi:ketosteroid isomerase-like protein